MSTPTSIPDIIGSKKVGIAEEILSGHSKTRPIKVASEKTRITCLRPATTVGMETKDTDPENIHEKNPKKTFEVDVFECSDEAPLAPCAPLAAASGEMDTKGQRENIVQLRDQGKFKTFRRSRSLNAPSPIYQFGPCARIMKNSTMVMSIQDPASQRLTWSHPPLTVLVIKKVHDTQVIQPFVDLITWLCCDKRLVVFIESSVLEDAHLRSNPSFWPVKDKLCTFKEGHDDITDKIDFIICLGGDGTLLYASSLFQQSVPPVMAFHLGSLGFLTPFQFNNFQDQVTTVLEGHAALTLRSRLRCTVNRKSETHLDKTTAKPNVFLVLNEVVVDRGPSPYLSNIDLFIDGKHITTVQGDGLIVSTPTGSTAYAVAAGASMIHPSVPAVLVTPICPHSLSFRPIVVPAGVELKIMVAPDARSTAWVSFDGRHQQELKLSDSLRVITSIYPVPSICAQDQIGDWFASLAECLHWNVRRKQRQLDDYSDEMLKTSVTTTTVTVNNHPKNNNSESSATTDATAITERTVFQDQKDKQLNPENA